MTRHFSCSSQNPRNTVLVLIQLRTVTKFASYGVKTCCWECAFQRPGESFAKILGRNYTEKRSLESMKRNFFLCIGHDALVLNKFLSVYLIFILANHRFLWDLLCTMGWTPTDLSALVVIESAYAFARHHAKTSVFSLFSLAWG